jgi:serine protease Do
VTIECVVQGSTTTQGSGWPLDPVDLGAAPWPSGTLIVTNGHVVGDCVEAPVVFLHDQRRVAARILDIDWDRSNEQSPDLALLAVDVQIPTFPIAREAAVGQWVMAAGSPIGLAGTVTFGAIANRRGTTIFTDAAIGPGNSGGPLFDSEGRVIGTNKAVYIDFQGLSIADSVDALCLRLVRCS